MKLLRRPIKYHKVSTVIFMSEQRRKEFDKHHSNFQTPWINPYSKPSHCAWTPEQQMTPIKTSRAISQSIHSNVTDFSAAHLSSTRNYSLTLPSYSTNSPTSPRYSSDDRINIYGLKPSHYRLFNFLFLFFKFLYLI